MALYGAHHGGNEGSKEDSHDRSGEVEWSWMEDGDVEEVFKEVLSREVAMAGCGVGIRHYAMMIFALPH
uniref:Uncharacterized protein n=1 Tax=Oryza punctata TaxID=4537 RepID=A0A0E0JKD1_ORYPU